MRKMFHEELHTLLDRLNGLVSLVDDAMRDANAALIEGDGSLAVAVIAGDEAIARGQADVDAVALDILARQQPVATDLRTVVACLRMSVDLRRMGRLATHVAEIARAHLPGRAVPEDIVPAVRAMADRAQRLLAGAARAIASRDATAAAELERADEDMDRLQEELYHAVFTEPRSWAPRDVVDIALIGRYYERCADHAVALARNVAFLSGTRPLDTAATGT
jgi:phosphate transport system protein